MPRLCEKPSVCNGIWGVDIENNRKLLDCVEQGRDKIHPGFCKDGGRWLMIREFGVGQHSARDQLGGLCHCYGKRDGN